jgi:hypothetical protein
MNPSLRSEANNSVSSLDANFYLPIFTNYADYDFRNEQAILLLEDLLWESPYSTYSFYDYLTLTSTAANKPEAAPIIDEMLTLANSSDYDRSNGGAFPSSSQLSNFQSDDYYMNYKRLSSSLYSAFPILNEISEHDEQYLKAKANSARLTDWDTNLLFLMDSYNTASSYLQVFNQFTTNYEDYNWASAESTPSSTDLPAAANNVVASLVEDQTTRDDLNDATSTSTSATHQLNIRPSVKDSIVNYNAFQKVFRSRLDEGRAHVNASHFSNLGTGQPFLNDFGLPYTDLLGKNRVSYYSAPMYSTSLKPHFNSLSSVFALSNTPSYEFPFLDALRSDLIRYTWIDGYSK